MLILSKPLTVKLLVDFNGPIAICIQQLEETDSFDAVEFHTSRRRGFRDDRVNFPYEESQVCVVFWSKSESRGTDHFLE